MAPLFRVEIVRGRHLLRGGIIPVSAIKAGQRWMPADSTAREVEIVKVVDGWVTYTWETSDGVTESHEKLSFPFQCRYCLVLDPPEVPRGLQSRSDAPL